MALHTCAHAVPLLGPFSSFIDVTVKFCLPDPLRAMCSLHDYIQMLSTMALSRRPVTLMLFTCVACAQGKLHPRFKLSACSFLIANFLGGGGGGGGFIFGGVMLLTIDTT